MRDAELVVWGGDFNYRIETSYENAKEWVSIALQRPEKYARLLEMVRPPSDLMQRRPPAASTASGGSRLQTACAPSMAAPVGRGSEPTLSACMSRRTSCARSTRQATCSAACGRATSRLRPRTSLTRWEPACLGHRRPGLISGALTPRQGMQGACSALPACLAASTGVCASLQAVWTAKARPCGPDCGSCGPPLTPGECTGRGLAPRHTTGFQALHGGLRCSGISAPSTMHCTVAVTLWACSLTSWHVHRARPAPWHTTARTSGVCRPTATVSSSAGLSSRWGPTLLLLRLLLLRLLLLQWWPRRRRRRRQCVSLCSRVHVRLPGTASGCQQPQQADLPRC